MQAAVVRDDGPRSHLTKAGTPTMGGVLILIGIATSTLLWFDWSNRFVWIVLLVTFGFGAIGWVDDWRKVVHRNPKGLPARWKYLWQSLIGLVAALYLAFSVSETSNLRVLELFLRGVGVEPQEGQARARHRAAEHQQFAGAGDVREQQVAREDRVADDVRKHAERRADHHDRHDRQPVQPVGEVDRVAGADDDESLAHGRP